VGRSRGGSLEGVGFAMTSIIIPAHNEEAVIGRTLGVLLEGAAEGEFDVIVACNGCTDRTAQVARGFGGAVRVIEVETPSKIAALNAGDAAARGFPRFYLDADIDLTADAVRRVAAALDRGECLAASPRARMDLAGCSWAVRAFYRVWERLPSHGQGMAGAGVYALSEAGRARFGAFPSIIADDGYIRLLFGPGERRAVSGAESRVTPPRRLSGLIKIKTRSHLGNMELAERFPELAREGQSGDRGGLLRLAANPLDWPAVGVYALVKAVARLRAQRQFRARRLDVWERDDTSRQAA